MDKNEIRHQLDLINKNILESHSKQNNIGLLNGLNGSSLFLTFYNKYILKNCSLYKLEEIFNVCIEKINNSYRTATFCDGISGFLWTLIFLQKNNFIDSTNDEIFDSLDDYIIEWSMFCINHSNFDFLHGSTGSIIYVIKRIENSPENLKKFKPLLENFIKGLQKRYYEIMSFNNFETIQEIKNRTYLGLAHGIASIIFTLSKLIECSPSFDTHKYLLDLYINFLFSTIKKSSDKISLFPSWLSQETNIDVAESALSWCTGDLGIGISLLNNAEITKDKNIRIKAIEILKHSAMRQDYKNYQLTEPGICHGYFGAFKIFTRAYNLTGIKDFFTAKEFWFRKGWEYLNENEMPNDFSILNGQAGIGLALIDAYTETDHKWGECMLIS